ncbi:MAG: FkbM family methyltransferase [Ekhidna sp.]
MLKRQFKSILRKNIMTSSFLDVYFITKFYLDEKGWTRSRRTKRPVTKDGDSLPWLTYPAIEFVKERLKSNFEIFEFGSGNSTLFFSERVQLIISVESDRDFFELLQPQLSSKKNVEYLYKNSENSEFSESILPYKEKFDVVIVDGADRVNCGINAVDALKSDGVIIWDNSDRKEYQDGYDYLIKKGFKRIDFVGHGPIGYKEWATSIFYLKENCFGI